MSKRSMADPYLIENWEANASGSRTIENGAVLGTRREYNLYRRNVLDTGRVKGEVRNLSEVKIKRHSIQKKDGKIVRKDQR